MDKWFKVIGIAVIIGLVFFILSLVREFRVATENEPAIRLGFVLTWLFMALGGFARGCCKK